jgi:hypothetical protein
MPFSDPNDSQLDSAGFDATVNSAEQEGLDRGPKGTHGKTRKPIPAWGKMSFPILIKDLSRHSRAKADDP